VDRRRRQVMVRSGAAVPSNPYHQPPPLCSGGRIPIENLLMHLHPTTSNPCSQQHSTKPNRMIVGRIPIHGMQDCGLVSFDSIMGWGSVELVALAPPPSGVDNATICCPPQMTCSGDWQCLRWYILLLHRVFQLLLRFSSHWRLHPCDSPQQG